MFELVDAYSQNAVIRVIGVGGGGGNAVQHMVKADLEGVDFICANTDSQALKGTNAKSTLQLGVEMTKGLGAGANPEVGRQSAIEDRDRIHEVISGTDMLFITAGMGGGTGTGAAPIVAEVARELGILTVAVVTKPFNFEGKKRKAIADRGIQELSNHVDSLITIPNEKLLTVLGKEVTMEDAFTSANDILLGAVQGIAEIITCPGLINVDFADVKTVMSEMGLAMMGSGLSQGSERAREAAEAAISSPLLEDVNITGARGILVNVTAGPSLGIGEIAEIGEHIEELSAEDATVVVGTVIDEAMGDNLRVTLVATGIGEQNAAHATPVQAAAAEQTVTEINISKPEATQAPLAATGTDSAEPKSADGRYDEALLDVPAFLRRQAD